MANTTLWKDFPQEQKEVGLFLIATNTMSGYPDGTFRPYDKITEIQVVRVLNRAGIRTDLKEENFNYVPATMKWTETNFLPGTVFSAKPDEECTRFRLAMMLFRYRNSDGSFKKGPNTTVIPTPLPIDSRIEKLNKLFYIHKWNGKLTPFAGHEKTFIRLSDETGVPLKLALAQAWKESCWLTNGRYPWGIKGGNGFKTYESLDAAIEDYYKLIRYGPGGRGTYWKYLQAGNLDALVELYAPSVENNHASYMQTLRIVMGWVEDAGL